MIMSADILFLIVLALSGVYASRLALKVAPWQNEFPLKMMFSTGLAITVVILSWSKGSVDSMLWYFSAVTGLVFIAGPFLLTLLARAQHYHLVENIAKGLYWTEEGRQTVNRLLAQVALQKINTTEALRLAKDLPENELILLQAYGLQERWQELLDLPTPPKGDNAFLGLAARVKAFIQLEEIDFAEDELQKMQTRFETEKGPIAYRCIELSRARLYAARGNLNQVQEILKQPLHYVHPVQIYEILAQAAEQSDRFDVATKMYIEAYKVAPEGLKASYAKKLTFYREPIPQLSRQKQPFATFGLLGAIVIAFFVQLWLERPSVNIPMSLIFAFMLDSNTINSYLARLELQVLEADAWWRYFSYAFVHGGFFSSIKMKILHVSMNSWVLFDIGRIYELRRHWGSLLAAFVAGTFMGAYITSIVQQGDTLILVGASGGVLGIGGALLADAWLDKQRRDPRLFNALLQWIGIIVIFSLAIPNVSLWGHVGGIIGGLLWGFARQGLPEGKNIDLIAGSLSIVLMAYAVFMAGSLLLA